MNIVEKSHRDYPNPEWTPHEPAKENVLNLLAKEWDLTGPPGILDLSDIVAIVPFAPSDTMAAIMELYEKGLVDMNKLKTSVFLTPEGYEAAEKLI
jgi:Mn-dependent DtxR family transcriptional regulator